MVDVEYIRKLSLVQHWSVRRIAKQLGLSRNTVTKYLMAKDPAPRYRLSASRPRPVLGPFEALVAQWIDSDRDRKKKQRHTAHRIFERLRDEYGFCGAESTIRKYVRRCKGTPPEAYLPLEYAPGAEAQCDFGEAEAVVARETMTVHLFCMRLMEPPRSFVMAFPHEKSEAFQEGHAQAFLFFGGVPKKIRYDNPRVAVKAILSPRERTEQKDFVALRSHYLFDSVYCLPGKKGAHEKGGVENLVGYCRRNYLVPLPEVADLASLNALLRERCLAEGRRIRPGEHESLGERFEREKIHLLPLPSLPFRGCRTVPALVNRLQQVLFDRCRYSVPTAFVGKTVTVHAFVDKIEIGCGEQTIAVHDRLYGTGKESFRTEHYLDQLDKKPSAVVNARVFHGLSEPYLSFRKRCLSFHPPRSREFVEVLKLLLSYPSPVVEQAVAEALSSGLIRADVVAQVCRRLTQGPLPEPVPHAMQVRVPLPDLARFDRLLPEVTR